MAAIFQLRRGSGSVSLVDGELYVNKGPDSLQYSVNDREITLAKLDEPNTGSLNLTGDITASNAYFTNNVKIDGKITVGNETGDTLNIVASLSSSLIPSGSKLFDLGSETNYYKSLYVETISSSFISGSIAGVGNIELFSASIDNRVDRLEASSSLYDNAMSGSNRLYVSPSGSDSNDGSDPSVPFRTIKAAVESLGSATAGNVKRYTIYVGSGNYTEQNPIAVPPGVAIVGDTLRTVRLTAANPTKDFFHVHDSNYFYGLRFLDLKHPAFAFSFPASTATSTISGGSISSIDIVHSLSGYVDGTNQDLGIIIEGPNNSGSIATATADVVSGVITQINIVNGGDNYAANEKPHISIPAPLGQRPVITTSPYVQNCSSITGPFNTSGTKVMQSLPYDEGTLNIDEQGAGGGIRIDGNLVAPASPLESFVADAFTQVNQGGPGHLVINKGYAQFVSCFTTFCTYGFKVANGGFANISNSVIDFGKYGLISKTYFPQTYNTGSSLETKTSTVSGFIIDENGAGYTGSVAGVTITGGGASVQATAEATVNANGSIDEIVLLTPGSGYTTQPSVTIDTPTGPGAILATTVNNKALISGVTEILMALESGSRGIDISSNMILNGVDYLVTDVQEVSGQPNSRRITTYPAPPSVQTNDQIKFHQLSNISTGGLVMEYVGSGVTYNALPKYGGVPVRTREINEFAPGRVFYSTVDNIGNLKIGDFFAVNQLTGEVTIDANSFNLSGLNAIGPFRRNGVAVGVVLQEVSNNTTLLNSQGLYGEDTAPTQYAVKEYVNSYTSSTNIRLNNLEITSASVKTSVAELNSYTASLKGAIELTGSTVSFLGDIVVYGTQSVINSVNLEVADNMIYLNSTSSTTNVDLGIIGNYNDGTYAHTGIYRDSSDGVWRVFKGYTAEPSGNIDLLDPSYRYADFYANALSASTLSGIGNITTYSTSVDSRLSNLETKSGSVDNSILLLNQFSASEDGKFTTLATLTGSYDGRWITLSTTTGSINTSLSNLNTTTASLNISVTNINSFTQSANIRLNELETSSGSAKTSINALNAYTNSLVTRWDNLATYTGSMNTYTSSINSDLTSIHQTTASLNQFSASATSSIIELYWTASDHEGRIDYLETVAGIGGGVSPNIRLSNLESTSASVNTSIANLNTFTASSNTSFVELNNWSSSAKVELSNLESFTSSINTTIKTKLDAEGVISSSNQLTTTFDTRYLNTGGDNAFSSSAQIGNYVATITGTENQIIVAGSGLNNAAVTLSTPQSIATTSDVTFNNITASAGIRATGDVIAYYSSDERLKENITPIENALSKVELISGNTYDWKEGFDNIHPHKGNDVGVIAQEIEKVLPQVVVERQNGYKAVDYEKIVPLLIEAIKELSAKVKELEKK